MKSKIILGDIKSKSLKETKDEINTIPSKLEKNDADLEAYRNDYNRLLQLNNHVDALFKSKVKEISVLNKKKD